MLDNIIMNILSETSEEEINYVVYNLIFQNRGWWNLLVPSISSGFFMEENNYWYQKHYVYIILWKKKTMERSWWFVIYIFDEVNLKKEQSSGSILLASSIMNIKYRATIYLIIIYLKNHVTYHSCHQLDSSMVKKNKDFTLPFISKFFFFVSFQAVNY